MALDSGPHESLLSLLYSLMLSSDFFCWIFLRTLDFMIMCACTDSYLNLMGIYTGLPILV